MSSVLNETPGLAAVRAWCGWHIAPSVTETVKVESEGGRVTLLPSLYVTGCTEVRDEDGSTVSDWKVRRNGVARGSWSAEVEYEFDITHGYAELPVELQPIVDELDSAGVGKVRKSINAGPFGESYGGATLEEQPMSVRAVVARYMIPNPA